MRTQVDHGFQFADQSFQGGDVRLRADHFNFDRFDRFLAIFDSNGFAFDNSTETSSPSCVPSIVKYVIYNSKWNYKKIVELLPADSWGIPIGYRMAIFQSGHPKTNLRLFH